MSRCHRLVKSCTEDLEKYQLGSAGAKAYEFLRDDLADWYLEISKTRIYPGYGGTDPDAAVSCKKVVVYAFDRAIRVLHPYMPFVTEMLFQHLPKAPKRDGQPVNALMLADWPLMDGEELVLDEKKEKAFEKFQSLVRAVRNARAEYNVEQGNKIPADFVVESDILQLVKDEADSIVLLARIDKDRMNILEAGSDEAKKLALAEGNVRIVADGGTEIFIPTTGLVDKEKEILRLTRLDGKLAKEIAKLEGRLNGKGFVDKAPKDVVDKARQELEELVVKMEKVKENLKELQ